MDPINQTGQTGGGSKNVLYIIIGVLVILLIGGYFMRGNFGMMRSVNVGGYNAEVNKKLDGSTTYKSDYGTVTTNSNTLPKNWPSDVPVYTNGTISQSTSSDMMGTNASQVTFTTSDSTQTILDFYKGGLASSGWVSLYPGKPITGTQMGTITTLMAKKDSKTFSVMITTNKETGKQVVTITTGASPDIKDYKTGL